MDYEIQLIGRIISLDKKAGFSSVLSASDAF